MQKGGRAEIAADRPGDCEGGSDAVDGTAHANRGRDDGQLRPFRKGRLHVGLFHYPSI
jgi:hypothetical protein